MILNLFLGNMWANVNPPGGYNRAHIHPNCTWSGVYYVKHQKLWWIKNERS